MVHKIITDIRVH